MTQKKSKIPEFKSIEEEAEFWDTHDLTEFEDEFKPVKIKVAKPLEHIFLTRPHRAKRPEQVQREPSGKRQPR